MMFEYEMEMCNHIERLFPDLYKKSSTLPSAYRGSGKIKAIVLGADPTFISGNSEFEYVFSLENSNSPFFKVIQSNLATVSLGLQNIYVQNIIRNYFTVETSKNNVWRECAFLWMDSIKREFDSYIPRNIPVFVTTYEILKVVVGKSVIKDYSPQSIYERIRVFIESENIFGRKVLALFRHPKYKLTRWPVYSTEIKKLIHQ